MKENEKGYVIGVDGGGTKTAAALADLNGKILRLAKTGSSSPRNVGLKKAIDNLAFAIKQVLDKKCKILSSFLGLPTTEEEFKYKKEIIKKELLKHREILPIFAGKLVIGSDQLAGFRSGTDEKDGLMLLAGTGSVAHGWKTVAMKDSLSSLPSSRLRRDSVKEAKVNGWGYLSEEGASFWVGQRAIEAVWKDLDGRGEKTLLKKLIFQKLGIKGKENFIEKTYSTEPIKFVSPLSILVDEAAGKGDKSAKKILTRAAEELVICAKTVIRKLDFEKEFPLVLIGSMFDSKTIAEKVKKEIKKISPRAKIIRSKNAPVVGAVKLAIEEYAKRNDPA